MSGAVVVGGGPAGLAVAALLGRAGLPAIVLERRASIGDGWREHYDRLHLHTTRALSGLPGLPIPRSAGRWVGRDDVAAYLERYAAHHRLDVRTAMKVTGIARRDGGWIAETGAGEFAAPSLVLATGLNRVAHRPAWPGADGFAGTLLHASAYRNPAAWRGRDVLVVGAGNSGSEIAVDLADGGAHRVLLSVRTPPNILPRDVLGVPMQLPGLLLGHLPTRVGDAAGRLVQRALVPDLAGRGLGRPRRGVAAQFAAGATAPVLDVGLIAAVRGGRVTPVPAVRALTPHGAELADGSVALVDAVVAATGYRTGLEDLVGGLGVLDADGVPRPHDGVRGLHVVGYHPTIAGHLHEIGREAARVAAAIAGTSPAPAQPRGRGRRSSGTVRA